MGQSSSTLLNAFSASVRVLDDGTVYPTQWQQPWLNHNCFVSAPEHPQWEWSNSDRTVSRRPSKNWCTIRTVVGYHKGRHVIDFTPLGGDLDGIYLGLVTSQYTHWDTPIGLDNSDGFALNCNSGELIGSPRSLKLVPSAHGSVARVRFILDLTSATQPTLEIFYDNVPKDRWTLAALGINKTSTTTIYPVISCSGSAANSVMITAPLPCAGVESITIAPELPLYNRWRTELPEWAYDNHYQVSCAATKRWRTISTSCGYYCGVQIIDFIPLTDILSYDYIGMLSEPQADEKFTQGLLEYQSTVPGSGFSLNGINGELFGLGPLDTLGSFHTPDGSTRVRFIIDFNTQKVAIWYNIVASVRPPAVTPTYYSEKKGEWSFQMLNMTSNQSVYPVYSTRDGTCIRICAKLDGTCDPFIPSAAPPAMPQLAPIAQLPNEWCTPTTTSGRHDASVSMDWKYSNYNRTVERVAATGWRTIRSLYGYQSGVHTINFVVSRTSYNIQLGLVTNHFNQHWHTAEMGSKARGSGFRIQSHDGAVYSSEKVLRAQVPFGGFPGTRIRFTLDFTAQRIVTIWYDGTAKVIHSMDELGLPVGVVVYPAVSIGMDATDVAVTIEALRDDTLQSMAIAAPPSDAPSVVNTTTPVTATYAATGWSVDIARYELLEQTDSSAGCVYRARLQPVARDYAIVNGASSVAYGDFTLRRVDHHHASFRGCQLEIKTLARLPRHDNIIHIEHSFGDRINTKSDTKRDTSSADPIQATQSLFFVTELCYLTLQEVINHRKSSWKDDRLLFSPEEVLMVAGDISNALILLSSELVAHRDIKPDNILIRFPLRVSRLQVMNNLCQSGVSFVLTDFGCVFDFKENDVKATSMKRIFSVSDKRGGTPYTIAPEIAETDTKGSDGKTELNYEKADVWSLGLVILMMCASQPIQPHIPELFTPVLTRALLHLQPVASPASSMCIELLTNTLHRSPVLRWSSHDVSNRIKAPLAIFYC